MRDVLGNDRPNVNHLIYAAFERVARQFLTREVKRRAARFSSIKFTIFTNYLDSHPSFEDSELQRLFEIWRRHYAPGLPRNSQTTKATTTHGIAATTVMATYGLERCLTLFSIDFHIFFLQKLTR